MRQLIITILLQAIFTLNVCDYINKVIHYFKEPIFDDWKVL